MSLWDETGIDTNSINIVVGTNAPVALGDPRLAFNDGKLTYTPSANEGLGPLGDTVSVAFSATDILGNVTTNFTWSFRLALPTILNTNIAFLGGVRNTVASNIVDLLSTNGNSFTYRYLGSSSGLAVGMRLVNPDPINGYARTVLSFTEYPASNTVVVISRPAVIAELLQQGSMDSVVFTETTVGRLTAAGVSAGISLAHSLPLNQVLYEVPNLKVEIAPGSHLDLNAALRLTANFQDFQLTDFEAALTGIADFELIGRAVASLGQEFSDEIPLIIPSHRSFVGFVGVPPFVIPIWVDVAFNLDAGYDANWEASVEISAGVQSSVTIETGRRWNRVNGWSPITKSPDTRFGILGPEWQIEGSAELRVHCRPKVTVTVNGLAGVSVDAEPYVKLTGSFQANPLECEAALHAGLDSTVALNLNVWDDALGELPGLTFNLIPETLLWETNCQGLVVTTIPIPTSGGTATGGGIFASNATITVTASAFTGFKFANWRQNGIIVSQDPQYTFNVLSNRILVANFDCTAPIPPRVAVTLEPTPLRIVTSKGDLGIVNIRSGVSINNRGTVAFSAIASGNRSTVFSRTSSGPLIEPRPGSGLVSGYGVQINDQEDIAFIVGPGISGSDYCVPAPPPAIGCIETLSDAIVVYSVLTANAADTNRPVRTLTYSLVTEAQNTIVNPRYGPFVSFGPALSLNNAGQLAFVGDISFNRQLVTNALGTVIQVTNFATPIRTDALTRPLLADNGRIVLRSGTASNSPIVVRPYNLAQPAFLTDTNTFVWTGQYPGITDDGNHVAFVGEVGTNHSCLGPGPGLFLSSFTNGQWIPRRILGTNDSNGSRLFPRFHDYYRTCVASLINQSNAVKICFGAASPSGRVGLYSAVYDFDRNEVTSLNTLVEAAQDINGLGPATSFELFDSVNRYGEVVFWVQTPQGDAVVRTGRDIAAIDPLPELVDNGIITTDTNRLAGATNRVIGLAADGVTRVVLRVETPSLGQAFFALEDENGSASAVGLLSAPGSTNDAISVQVPAVDAGGGRFMAFAILRAPLDFVRASSGDETKSARPIIASVRFQPQAGGESQDLARQQFDLRRPPVVLLHGIWSESGTWQFSLARDPRFFVHAHDYSSTHAARFSVNLPHAEAAVDESLRRIRSERKIAAVQADYIGHSMGGILGRLYVATGRGPNAPVSAVRYQRSENYFTGDVHKLITIDTPHHGTPAANNLLSGGAQWQVLAQLFKYNGKCVDCGAVSDLRVDSEAITTLPAVRIPSHAIVGLGGNDARFLSRTDVDAIPDEVTRTLIKLIKISQYAPPYTPLTAIYDPESHDLLVSESSQRGGLSSTRVSTALSFRDPLNAALHTSVTGESFVASALFGLLNDSVTAGTFDRNGFPANTPALPPLAPSPRFTPAAVPPAFVQGLRFISPASGLMVAPGSNVVVTVSATNGFQPAKVLIVGPFGADLDEAAPFALNVQVPLNWLGPLTVKAVGVDTNGVFAESPELVLNVDTAATLTNLAVRPDAVYLFDYVKTKQVEVFGQFSDGVERKLVVGEQRLITIDPSVATVTTNGLVEARGLGQTTLWVRNGPFAASAPVVVLGAPFANAPSRPTQHLEIIKLGTNIADLTDVNNAGQVLIHLYASASTTRPAIWEDGGITPLTLPAGQSSARAYALSESGVACGSSSGGPTLWFGPSNIVHLTYTNGPLPGRWYDAGIPDVQDTDSGLRGILGIPGDCGGFGDCGPATFFRTLGSQIAPVPISAQGIPAGYGAPGLSRINRNGVLMGAVAKVQGGVLLSTRPITLDPSDRLTLLEGWDGYGAAQAINDAGEVVGSLSGGYATLWHDSQLDLLWTGEAKSTAINNRGHVAIYRAPNFGPPNGAAIWANGQIVALTDLFPRSTGWASFGQIYAMNDKGWLLCIAGDGVTSGGFPVLIKLAPTIRQQPISRTKVPGQQVTISVIEYSFGAAYQWRHNGVNVVNDTRVSGANSTRLTIDQIELSDAGAYDLLITDAYGATTSSNAVLTVLAEGCLSMTNGLVAHWSGDGHAQEVLNRYNATLLNGAGFSNGLVNAAFAFDGVNDSISTDLDVNPNVMSVTTWEAWIYPTRTNYTDYQEVFDDLKDNRVLYIQAGDQFTVSGTGGGLPRVSLNEWQHIALVFHPTWVEFYKNTERFVTWYVPSPTAGPSLLTIGTRSDGTMPFKGLIDEVGIYSRALSQDEIQAIYDVSAAGKCRPGALPSIVSQPPSQVTYTGFDVNFTVGVFGTTPLTYRWYLNSTNLVASSFDPNLTLRQTQPTNGGDYTVVASNSFGVVTSAVARLTVRPSCESQWTKIRDLPWTVHAMAYDDFRHVTVLLSSGQTWFWDGNGLGLAQSSGSPGSDGIKMVYDHTRHVCVVFGGVSGNETWEWNGVNWYLAATSIGNEGPARRTEYALAYDSLRQVTVLHGGTGPEGWFGDTWEWDGLEWILAPPLGSGCSSPGRRRAHEMVFDSLRQKVILFGGALDGSSVGNDTWEWDGSCWTQIRTIQAPPPRLYFAMAYHSGRNSTVLHGGSGIGTSWGDTWEFVGNSWIKIPGQDSDLASYEKLAYDSSRSAFVLVHGREIREWSAPRVPAFGQQPSSQTLFVGSSVILNSCATGQGDLAYQWFNGTNAILGASASDLLIDPIEALKGGSYRVVVSNAHGSVTSVVAKITVLPCQSAPADAVAWWRGEGDTADAVGTNHGTLLNGTGFAVGKVGQAWRFDGVDDFVLVPRSTNLFLRDANGFTLEGWIQPRDWQPRPLVEWNGGSNDNASVGVHLWTSVATNGGLGSLFANIRGTNLVDHIFVSSPSLVTGAWQHVALTYARALGAGVLYLNGSVVATQAIGTFRTATTPDVYLGARPGATNVFAGLMDEITIYNRALSASEIASIAAAGSAGKCAEPDGTPYIYVNGVHAVDNPFTVLSDMPAQAALLSTYPNGAPRYTMDGSSPSNGVLYTGPFALPDFTTLQAIAFTTNGTTSQPVARTIQRLPTSAISPNHLRIVSRDTSGVSLILFGTPNRRYVLERSTELGGWTPITSTIAPLDGVARMKDASSPIQQAFYRAMEE